MAYKTINATTVSTLTKNYNDEAKLYEAEKDKKKQKELKASLDLRAGKILDTLMKDIDVYDKNATERYLNIDNRLTRAVNLIKDGKTALATFIKTRSFDQLAIVTDLPDQFDQLDQEEKNDDRVYCDAQFAYRNNPASFDKIQKISGEKFVKPMMKVRQGTIDENKKHIQPKLDKIAQLAKMATQLVVEANLAERGAKADLTEIRTLLADAAKEADDHVKVDTKGNLVNMRRQVEGSLVTMKTQAASKPMTETNMNMVQSLLDNIIGQVKSAKIVVAAMADKEKSVKEAVPKSIQKDPAITKSLSDIRVGVKGMQGILEEMAKVLKEAMGVLTLAKSRFKR